MSGLISKIVSLFAILAIQASRTCACYTLYSTGYTEKVDSIFVEIFSWAHTFVSCVVSTVAIDARINAHSGSGKKERLVSAVRIANSTDSE